MDLVDTLTNQGPAWLIVAWFIVRGDDTIKKNTDALIAIAGTLSKCKKKEVADA